MWTTSKRLKILNNGLINILIQSKYLLSPIQKGDLVEFEVKENSQGLYAVAIQKIN